MKNFAFKNLLPALLVLLALVCLSSFSCGLGINYRINAFSPAQNGIISVFKYSKNGPDHLLITSSFLENSRSEFVLNPSNELILISLSKITVYDFVSSTRLKLDDLSAWESFVSKPRYTDNFQTFNINPITTIASGLAKHLVSQTDIRSNHDIKIQINDATELISKSFGVIDILELIPSKLDTPSDILTDQIKYGLLLNAFFELPRHYEDSYASNFKIDVLSFTQSIFDDISYDGHIDGIAEYGKTDLGRRGIGAEALKGNLALSIYRIISNTSINKTGLTFSDISTFLDHLCKSESMIFRENAVKSSFDIYPPEINCFSVYDGEHVSGLITFECNIQDDMPGVKDTVAFFSGQEIQNSYSSPDHFLAFIDTTLFPNGIHLIEVTSRDFIGNQKTEIISLIIAN